MSARRTEIVVTITTTSPEPDKVIESVSRVLDLHFGGSVQITGRLSEWDGADDYDRVFDRG